MNTAIVRLYYNMYVYIQYRCVLKHIRTLDVLSTYLVERSGG